MMQNVPHQILQSPGRLVLPNPNSPSLPSSNVPKFSSPSPQPVHSIPSVNQWSVPTVSSALLPLLPPLPRAQSLLIQMAALASKLFHVSPNRAHWISAFRGSLPSFLSSQIQPSASSESLPSSAKEIVAQFTSLQTQLFEAVGELKEILDLQDAKQKLAREIRLKDSALLAFTNKLKEAENVLDILVDDYSDYHRTKRTKTVNDGDDSSTTTVATQLKLSDITSYAHKISYTTFAHPEFGAGEAPLRGALPPAPQEEQMRASQLYSFAEVDVGLPVTEKEKTEEPLILVEPTIENSATVEAVRALQGLIPPNMVVPSGWKPGMPVELPVPPPGWKPGDPITLPLDSLAVPARIVSEQPQLRPVLAPGLAKPLETIQVRHVQLDIEDDSSDYSSDDGSSDTED